MATTTESHKGKAEHVGKEVLDKAKEAGASAADKAKGALSSVAEKASQAAGTAGKRADDMTAGAGAEMKKWADTMEGQAPQEGLLGQASHAVAETLREGGKYLEDAKFSGMADDVSKMIRRNPMPAVLIGVGIGFILGRALRS